jgi:tetratricopeptide (TPR) repeat protein
MDLTQHLHQLESLRDWQGLVEALESAIDQEADAAVKAAYYLKLGRVMTDKLLQGPRALRHFQSAWKLQPENVEPLARARNVYWELGKFKMVETVLRRSLESASGDYKSEFLAELGDVNCDLRNYEASEEHYAAAIRDGGLQHLAGGRDNQQSYAGGHLLALQDLCDSM